MPPLIDVKGIKEGLLVTLPDGRWDEVEQALIERLVEGGDFFKGARVALQVAGRPLGASDLGRLRDQLDDLDMSLWVVLSESMATENAARSLGLETSLPKPPPPPIPEIDPEEEGGDAVLVRRTLRSGRSVYHDGHVVIIGDVNAGAEVVAGGDIVVWGRLHGMVHAGADGDEEAVVCALDLTPTQLRIGSRIAISPSRRGKPDPEMAHVRDGRIVAERWGANNKKRGRK
ncbi:MAG: septum site-determining protein MinC [Anaerolineales bacterium]